MKPIGVISCDTIRKYKPQYIVFIRGEKHNERNNSWWGKNVKKYDYS